MLRTIFLPFSAEFFGAKVFSSSSKKVWAIGHSYRCFLVLDGNAGSYLTLLTCHCLLASHRKTVRQTVLQKRKLLNLWTSTAHCHRQSILFSFFVVLWSCIAIMLSTYILKCLCKVYMEFINLILTMSILIHFHLEPVPVQAWLSNSISRSKPP